MKLTANDIGRERQLITLRLTSKFGHLRPADLAIYFALKDIHWPKKIAERTYRVLSQKGLVIARSNVLGGTSYVLSATGARQLQKLDGISAKTGKDLTTIGPSFIHRTLGSIGLIILENLYKQHSHNSLTTYSEYEMQRALGPIDTRGRATRLVADYINETLEYVPDGLIETSSGVIDWLEVEASWKNTERLRAKLKWLSSAFQDEYQQLYGKKEYSVGQLRCVVWVVPVGKKWFDHEARLRKEIARLDSIPSANWVILRLHVTQQLSLNNYELIKI